MGVASQNLTLPCAIATFPVSLPLSSPGDVWPRLPLLASTRPWTSAHPSWPGMIWEIARKTKQNKSTHNTKHTVYSMATRQKWTDHHPSRRGYTACSRRSTPSLTDACRSQPPRGRRLVVLCGCIRVPPEVCSNGVISPPICVFCYCPLLPEYRQFEMAIGEFCCLVDGPDLDLGLGNIISPLTRTRGAVYKHIFLSLRGSWSLLWAGLPVPIYPHRIIGLHCSWGFGCWACWRRILSLEDHFKSWR